MGIFNVAVSGLNAAQVGILTTSHNISNASTDGYSRQQIIQTTNPPMFTGAGFLGQGSNVTTIQRIYSQQLNNQVLSASTGAAEMDSYLAQISQIDNLLADPNAGLSPALSSFFGAVQEMAAYPASLPARQSMLSASQALVSRFQAIDQRLREIRDGVNSQIASEVTSVNAYAAQIADINSRIILAEATSPNQPANDLLDQRDQLIAELNTKIRATTVVQNDGTFNVFIGNGQPLVVGTIKYSMKVLAAPDDPERTVVALTSPGGNTVQMPESMLTGGSIGGLIAFRSNTLDTAQNALGRIALTLADDFNAQHRQGLDLTGAAGDDYFVATSSLIRQPQSNSTNTGTGALSLAVTNASALTTSDYRLIYDGTSFSLLRLSDNTSVPYTMGAEVDGITLTLSGTPAAGDSFLIQPTRMGAANIALAITDPRAIAAALPPGGVADNRNALLLGGLQTANKMENGTATYQSAYSSLVAQIGNKAREVEISGKAQQSLLEQAEATRSQMSGVNLDEEAANLLRYQQAYQAAAKVISIASTLFDEILALGR